MEKSNGLKYKALALDLDGTLMDSNKKLPEVNKKAIWDAIDAGIAVILASGRPLFGVMPVAEQLELEQRGGYVLAFNGGNIWDCKEKCMVVQEDVPQDCMRDICEAAHHADVEPLTYYKDLVLVEDEKDEYVIKEAFCNSAKTYEVESVADFVDYPESKVLLVGEHSKLLPAKAELEAKHGDVLDLFFSEDYFLEVVPKNVNKAQSIGLLLEKLGIKQEELIACGDGMNDISMIQYAGLGVAMENAYPEVKESADYITISNDAGGVAEVIRKFML